MKILTITAKSATFELDGNLSPYFSGNNFLTELNGNLSVRRTETFFLFSGFHPIQIISLKLVGKRLNSELTP